MLQAVGSPASSTPSLLNASSSLKSQIVSLDRSALKENEWRFSQIAAGIMATMHDMLAHMADYVFDELLVSGGGGRALRLESFVMFAMEDACADKRLHALRTFLVLVERMSAWSLSQTSSATGGTGTATSTAALLASAAAVVSAAATGSNSNLSTSQLGTSVGSNNSTGLLLAAASAAGAGADTSSESGAETASAFLAKRDHLVRAMCNQLAKHDEVNDARLVEACIGRLLNQPHFAFATHAHLCDAKFIRLVGAGGQLAATRSHLVLMIVALTFAARRQLPLADKCLHFLHALVDSDSVRLELLVGKACLLHVMANMLRFYSDDSQLATLTTCEKASSNIKTAVVSVERMLETRLMPQLRRLYVRVAAKLMSSSSSTATSSFSSVADLGLNGGGGDMAGSSGSSSETQLSYVLSSLMLMCHDSASTPSLERLNANVKHVLLGVLGMFAHQIETVLHLSLAYNQASQLG